MEALGLVSGASKATPTREKLTFKSYFERELPSLKEDKPGLKLPQYKDIALKQWMRSPENPINQK